jgi:hypothetical protein
VAHKDDPSSNECGYCECTLHDTVHVYCLVQTDGSGEEMAICSDCWQSHTAELKEEGWENQDGSDSEEEASREVVLSYSAFVMMFKPKDDYSGYDDDDSIILTVKDVPCNNAERHSGGWCAFLWKPVGPYTGKWIRQEYNGSSPFALWWLWCQMDE